MKSKKITLSAKQIRQNKEENRKNEISYIYKTEDNKEFVAPKENAINKQLFYGIPGYPVDINGRVSESGSGPNTPSYFYFKPEELDKINNLCASFEIASPFNDDLTIAYLSMRFSSFNSIEKDNHFRHFDKIEKEFSHTLAFLAMFENQSANITTVSFKYQLNTGSTKTIKISGIHSIKLVENATQSFVKSHEFKRANQSNKLEQSLSTKFILQGHKNSEKSAQSFFARAIFNYLDNYIICGELIVSDLSISSRLKAKSQNTKSTMYHLIGKLMLLSGLLEMPDNYSREELIDLIEKKLSIKQKNK